MTGLSNNENPINRQGESSHELTKIRGVGVTKKQWLKALGIRTLYELAGATVDAIDTQLKHQGRVVSRSEIEGWIAQAQALVAEVGVQASPALLTAETAPFCRQEAEEEASLMPERSPHYVPEKTASIAMDLADWQTLATFRLELQTRYGVGEAEQRVVIQHGETGATDMWAEIEGEQLQRWMLGQLQSELPSEAGAAVAIAITQLRALKSHQSGTPMIADSTHRRFGDAIQVGELFSLEASIQFTGLEAVYLPKQQVVYRAQCFARHLASGTVISLGDRVLQASTKAGSAYTALFPEIVLEQPGAYRLQVMVALQNAPATMGLFKVPLLQVV
jgi:hypothetical protein